MSPDIIDSGFNLQGTHMIRNCRLKTNKKKPDVKLHHSSIYTMCILNFESRPATSRGPLFTSTFLPLPTTLKQIATKGAPEIFSFDNIPGWIKKIFQTFNVKRTLYCVGYYA